jgi:hypothetical protein
MPEADSQPDVPSAAVRRCRSRGLDILAGCALACLLAACSSSPEKKLAEAAKKVASWSSAAEMAGVSWQARRVPRRYAEAAAQAAQQGIEKERTGLAEAPKTLADERVASAVGEMSELSALAGRLWAAVRSKDRDEAGRVAHEIGARGRALRDASGR